MSAAQDTATIGTADFSEATNTAVPEQSAGPPGDQTRGDPLPRGYEIKGLAKPGDYDHVDMYEGINLNENLEGAFNRVYLYMLEKWEQGKAAAAEEEATRLLGWGKVPVLYRAYAHIVLAYGPMDNLWHACEAVKEAEWGVRNFGDQAVGLKLLAMANATLSDVRKSAAAAMNEPMEQAAAEASDKMEVDKPDVPAAGMGDKVATEEGPERFAATPTAPAVTARVWKPEEAKEQLEHASYFQDLIDEHESASKEPASKETEAGVDAEDEMLLEEFEGPLIEKQRQAKADREHKKNLERQADLADNLQLQQLGRSAPITPAAVGQKGKQAVDDDDEMLFDTYNPVEDVDDPITDVAAVPDVDDAVQNPSHVAKPSGAASSISGHTQETRTTHYTGTTSKSTAMTEASSQRADKKREHSDDSQDEKQEPPKKQKADEERDEMQK